MLHEPGTAFCASGASHNSGDDSQAAVRGGKTFGLGLAGESSQDYILCTKAENRAMGVLDRTCRPNKIDRTVLVRGKQKKRSPLLSVCQAGVCSGDDPGTRGLACTCR